MVEDNSSRIIGQIESTCFEHVPQNFQDTLGMPDLLPAVFVTRCTSGELFAQWFYSSHLDYVLTPTQKTYHYNRL